MTSVCPIPLKTLGTFGKHELMLRYAFRAKKGALPANKEIPPQEFNRIVRKVFKSARCGIKVVFMMMEVWIEWDGERFEFQDASSYSEKLWGGAFPRKWFWVQCNVFEGATGEVALTAACGLRQLLDGFENAVLVRVKGHNKGSRHYHAFSNFRSWPCFSL